MLYFIETNLISSLLDPRHVNPGSTLIHVGAYGSYQRPTLFRWGGGCLFILSKCMYKLKALSVQFNLIKSAIVIRLHRCLDIELIVATQWPTHFRWRKDFLSSFCLNVYTNWKSSQHSLISWSQQYLFNKCQFLRHPNYRNR